MNSKNSDYHINMNKENLNTIHEGERPFKCNVCDDSFPQKSALKMHVALDHEGRKPFQCNACNASFAQNVNLKNHLILVHEGKKPNQSTNRNTATKNTKDNKTELNKIFMREQQEMFDIKFQYTIENGIKKMLGEGGYSSVYEGKCKETNEKVAIKCVTFKEPRILTRKLLSKCDDIEYQLLKKCQGVEGVIKLYDFFQLEKEDIFVLQMPEGCQELNDHNVNFWKHNRDKKHLSYESYGRPIIKQAVEILNGCHKKKVFHGDIHLGNFLIDKYGKVFLIDFGLAKTVKKGGFLSCNFKNGPEIFDDFKPPEAYYDTNIHAESVTTYCLGIMLYEMLNGTDCPFANIEEALHGEVSFHPAFSPECQEIIQKCLEKDPRKRITLHKLEALVHSWMPVSNPGLRPSITAPPQFAPLIDLKRDSTTAFIFPKPAPENLLKQAKTNEVTRKRKKCDQTTILEVNAREPALRRRNVQHQASHLHFLPQQQNQEKQGMHQQQINKQLRQQQLQNQVMQQHQQQTMQLMQQPLPPVMQQPLPVMQQPLLVMQLMQQPMHVLQQEMLLLQQQMQEYFNGSIAYPQQAQQPGIQPGIQPGVQPGIQPGMDPGYRSMNPSQNSYVMGTNNPQAPRGITPGYPQAPGGTAPGFNQAAGAVTPAPVVADPSRIHSPW